MARLRMLIMLAILATTLLAAPTVVVASESRECSREAEDKGLCVTAQLDDDRDEVTLGIEAPGSENRTPTPGTGTPSDSTASPGRVETGIFESTDGIDFVCADNASELCTTVTRAPRVSDLASFGAAAPTLAMEPNGWIAVGLPSNFIASASPHTRTGPLLNREASVEFIPVGYRWDFGDGTTTTTTTGGASWASRSSPEFSHTPTSHVFRQSGAHTITASVVYRARFAYASNGTWFDIPGTLSVPTSRTVSAFTVKTVLVARDCIADPRGPGC